MFRMQYKFQEFLALIDLINTFNLKKIEAKDVNKIGRGETGTDKSLLMTFVTRSSRRLLEM